MVRPVWHGPGDTLWEEHSKSCKLTIHHCHVGDQIYYTDEEFTTVYPDGQLPQLKPGEVKTAPVGTPLDKVKEWISVGFTSGGPVFGPADHTDHVHVAVFDSKEEEAREAALKEIADDLLAKAKTDEIKVGTLVTKDENGHMRPTRPGETPYGIVRTITMTVTGGGSVDVEPMEDHLRRTRIDPDSTDEGRTIVRRPVSDHSTGGIVRAMDINITSGPPWSDAASDPVGDVVRARDLMRAAMRRRTT